MTGRDIQILRNATVMTLENLETHKNIIALCGGNVRNAKRALEDAIEAADKQLMGMAAEAQKTVDKAAKTAPAIAEDDEEESDEEPEDVGQTEAEPDPAKEPGAYNRKRISEALENQEAEKT